MTPEELGKLFPINLVPYNKKWVLLFEKEKSKLLNILGKNLRIEHIGSTAIPGLMAKPTVDILLEKPSILTTNKLKQTMGQNGYLFMKEQTKHLMFVKGYTPTGLGEESYHIHVGPLSQNWLWDRIYFRDYLIQHKQEALRYGRLKKALASKYRYDREAYTNLKSNYVKIITQRGKELSMIESNKRLRKN